MASSLPNSPLNSVVDASLLVALCAREFGRYDVARDALEARIACGCALNAPQLVVMEVMYALCKKASVGTITDCEHTAAVRALQVVLADVIPPRDGDASLIARAERIRHGYGCSRSADSMYIALAELLAVAGPSELLTFDAGQRTQAAAAAPSVIVTVLNIDP